MPSPFTFKVGDRVRLATEGPGPTDPVGVVIEVGAPWVRVRWPAGAERSYHPVALELLQLTTH